jgi:signal peptidase I
VSGLAEALRENVVAFALAIVMALTIKHFALEAFRIPTSSMRPTLLGKEDAGPDKEEDRIVVDKWAYLLQGAERWDVAVFRYPLDLARNFIKRVAGVGPEWMRIAQGDVWVRKDEGDPWRPAPKRRRVREQLYRRVYPPKDAARRETAHFLPTGEKSDGWRVEHAGLFEFEGGAEARIKYAHVIGAEGTSHAQDVRLQLTVVPTGPGMLTLGFSPEGGWRAEARFAVGDEPEGSGLAFRQGSEQPSVHRLAARLVPGRATAIEWEIVDGEAHVHVDGSEVAVVPFSRDAAAGDGEQSLTLAARGAPLTLKDLAIDRDLHYTQESGNRGELFSERGLWVPDDRYVMLGDNTTSSSDSRAWKAGGLRLKDGREIRWNLSGDSGHGPRRVPGTDQERVVDLDGVERTWSDDEVDGELDDEWITFVPRANLVGRAFYVFWPAFPDFPRRLGWIR